MPATLFNIRQGALSRCRIASALLAIFMLATWDLSSQAANFTTAVQQVGGNNWNQPIWNPDGVSPAAGNTYEVIAGGNPSRIRNPVTFAGDIQTFPGDQLTLHAYTEIRAKTFGGCVLDFPGMGGAPGLVFDGANMDPSDEGIFTVTGVVDVRGGVNFGNGASPNRGWILNCEIRGQSLITLGSPGSEAWFTNNTHQLIVAHANNPFSGGWNIHKGYLHGTGVGSLGSANIMIAPAAYLEVDYDINTPGSLTLVHTDSKGSNSVFVLHQNCTFGTVRINRQLLPAGAYTWAQLNAQFPGNFPAPGSGSITVSSSLPAAQANGLNGFIQMGGNRTGYLESSGQQEAFGEYLVIDGGGFDQSDNGDECAFAYHEIAGDFDIQVQVPSSWRDPDFSASCCPKSGLAMRESLAEDSRRVIMMKGSENQNDNYEFLWRTGAWDVNGHDGGTYSIGSSAFGFPNAWLRLVRQGTMVTGYRSPDGMNWTQQGSLDTSDGTWTNFNGSALEPLHHRVYVGVTVSKHGGNVGETLRTAFQNYNEYSAPSNYLAGADSFGQPELIRVFFSRPVDFASLDPNGIDFLPTVLSGSFFVGGVRPGPAPNIVDLLLDPAFGGLAEGAVYELQVSGTVLDTSGNPVDPTRNTGSFTHGQGYEPAPIHLGGNNPLIVGDENGYPGSAAYATGSPACIDGAPSRWQSVPAMHDNVLGTPEGPAAANDYDTRILGVLNLATAGNYVFGLMNEDGSKLFLSSNDQPVNEVQIAAQACCVGDFGAGAKSAPQALAAGHHLLDYEYHQGAGGHHGGVAWDAGTGAAIVAANVPIDASQFIPSRFAYGQIFYTLGPAVITAGPTDMNAPPNSPASFTVAVDGTPPYTYTWKTNGQVVEGLNAATFTIPSAAHSLNGLQVSCCVSNLGGGSCSTNATLTVTETTQQFTPSITVQPQSQTNIAETAASFSVTATGAPPLFYQWQSNGTNLADDGRVSGSQSNSVTLANLLLSDAGNYQVIITNAYGSVTSAVATLDVLRATPTLVWPSPEAISYGTSLSSLQLNAASSVPGVFVYAPGPGAAPDAGTNTLSVVFTPTDAADYNSANSQVTIVVTPAPLTITPDNKTRLYGTANPVFTGTVVGIQNGDNIIVTYGCGAELSSPPGLYPIVLSLTDPDSRLGNYIVTTANGTLTVTCATIALSPSTLPVAAVGADYSQDLRASGGAGSYTFAVTTGSLPTGLNLSSSGTLSGTPTATGSNTFTVTATDTNDCSGSQGYTLEVQGIPPSITAQPQSMTNLLGATASFMVTASGTPPLSYQWQCNGTNLADALLISGSQSNTLTLANLLQSDAGDYHVIITNTYGSVTSVVATLTIFTETNFTLGSIPRQVWFNIAGNAVSDLTSNPRYPNSPDAVDYLTSMGWPQENIADNYGGRLAGYLVPPLTGTYTFAVRSDDTSQLYLSTNDQDSNRALIAEEAGCCNGFDAHASAPIPLVAGQRYYLEALMKEAGGGDYLYVAWKSPLDPANWVVIPGTYLGYYMLTNSLITIVQQPTGTNVECGQTVVLNVTASATDPLSYQWQFGGANLTDNNRVRGSQSNDLTITSMLVSDAGNYTVVVSTSGGSVTSSVATLTVTDMTPPVLTGSSNILVTLQAGATGTNVSFAVSATDACDGSVLATCTPASGSAFPPGVTTVNCTASDASGNTGTSSFTVTVASCTPAPSGLVAWWPAEGDANDVAGTNNGTLQNGAGFSAGMVGSAFSFDGVDDYIEVPNSPSLNPWDAITVEAWYKPTVSFVGNGDNSIVDKGYYSHVNPYYQYHLGVVGDSIPAPQYRSRFSFVVSAYGNNVSVYTPSGFWSPGNWYHLVGTYDGSAVKLYVNGTLIVSAPASGPLMDYGKNLRIGAFGNLSSPDSYTPGLIDEVAIYSRALSSNEIAGIYAAESAGKCRCSPKITCPQNLTQNTDPGQCTAVVNFVTPSAADNCPGVIVGCNPPSGATFSTGTTTVNCTATDSSGNTASCSFTVTVNDIEPPKIQCSSKSPQGVPKGLMVYSTAGNELRILNTITGQDTPVPGFPSAQIPVVSGPTWLSNGTCILFSGGISFHSQIWTVHPDGSGLYRLTDGSGDLVWPSAPTNWSWIVYHQVYGNVFTNTLAGGHQTVVPVRYLSHTRASRDGRYIIGSDWAVPTYHSDVYIYDVLTGTTNMITGNLHTSPNDAFHRGDISPDNSKVVVTHGTGVGIEIWVMNLDGSNPTNLTADWPTGEHNTPVWSPDQQFILFNSNHDGSYDIWAMRPDGSGKVNLTQTPGVEEYGTVDILGQPDPVVLPTDPLGNYTVSTDLGQCSRVLNYDPPAATDNCPGVGVACTPPPRSVFPKGLTTVTCTATDASANTASCSFSVTVNDTEGPQITCPQNVTQATDPGQSSAVVNYPAPVATDNCSGVIVACNPPAGSTFLMGTSTVTCTATDASGSTVICSFAVKVEAASTGGAWQRIATAAPWPARYDHASVAFNGRIWVLGGILHDNPMVLGNDVWSSADGAGWDVATPNASWSARAGLGCVVFQDKLWVIGGAQADCTTLNDIWASSDGATWSLAKASAAFPGRANPGLLAFNGKLWVIGGQVSCTGELLNDVWSSSDGTNWTEVIHSAPWAPRPGVVTEYRGRIWLLGGVIGPFSRLNDVWSSADGLDWRLETLSAGWSGRSGHSVISTGGGIFLLGGYDGGSSLNDVWTSPDGVSWTERASSTPWSPRYYLGSVFHEGSLWVLGGGDTLNNDVWKLPVATPPPLVYDAAGDFSTGSNPNGAWSYGWASALGAPLNLFNQSGLTAWNSPIEYWWRSPQQYPLLFHNQYSTNFGSLNLDIPPGGLDLHPSDQGDYAVVRWTAPVDGYASITGAFRGNDMLNTTTDVHVLTNGTPLFDEAINALGEVKQFSAAMGVQAGDTIDFVVGWGADMDYGDDNTGLAATITLNTAQITCPSNVTQTADPGECMAVVNYPTPIAMDNYPWVTVGCTPPSGATFPTGTTTVNCTATDRSGNTASCSFTVTVNDIEAPQITCPPNVTQSTDAGQCTAIVNYPTPSATDNCPGVAVACNPPSGTAFPKGINQVTCTATDASGNAASCSFAITVNDTENPNVACPLDVSQATDPGQTSAVVNYPTPIATDNCPGVIVACNPPAGSTFQKGSSTVTCISTDTSSNTVTCSFTVTVNDTEAPVIHCSSGPPPQNIPLGKIVYRANNSGLAILDTMTGQITNVPNTPVYGNAVSPSWYCSDGGQILFTGGSFLNSQVYRIHPDGSGLEQVTHDSGDISEASSPADCQWIAFWYAYGQLARVQADGSPLPLLGSPVYLAQPRVSRDGKYIVGSDYMVPPGYSPHNDFYIYEVETGTLTRLTADYHTSDIDTFQTGDISPDNSRIVMTHGTGPGAQMDVWIMNRDGSNPINLTSDWATSREGYPRWTPDGQFILFSSNHDGNYDIWSMRPDGTGRVNLTKTPDIDEESPADFLPATDLPPANYSVITDPGQCTAVVNYPMPSATDNCPGVTVGCNPPSGATFPTGTTTVNCTATDSSGNTASCTFTVTVNDVEAPQITCAQNLNQNTDPGQCTAVVNFVTPGATDNCPGVAVACNPPSGTAFPKGTNQVACTATDAAGNTASCSFSVTVNETETPTILCPPSILHADKPAIDISFTQLEQKQYTQTIGWSFTVNSPIGVTKLGVFDADLDGLAQSHSVGIWDVSGHSIVSATVPAGTLGELVGNFRYTDIPRQLLPIGDYVIGAFYENGGPDWNAAVATTMEVQPQLTHTGSRYSNAATFAFPNSHQTARDKHFGPNFEFAEETGDYATHTDPGQCSAVVNYAAPDAADNCPGVAVACNPPSGAAFPPGTTTVSCMATDASGNSASCSFMVTVNDTENPNIACPQNLTQNTDPGQCSAVVTYATPSATDNCPGVTVGCKPPSGASFPKGATTVACTAIDASGNTAICSFTVTVNEPEAAQISISPTAATVGSMINISGTNFSTVHSSNIVYFGAVRATVFSASPTKLEVIVPPGAAYGPISVTVAGVTAYSPRPFVPTFASAHQLSGQSFAPAFSLFPGVPLNGIAIGDLDGDGRPDLVVITGTNVQIGSIYHNIELGGELTVNSFDLPIQLSTPGTATAVTLADLDGDGLLDLIVLSPSSGNILVFHNISTPGVVAFEAPLTFATLAGDLGALAVADLDDDGLPDVITTSYATNQVAVLRNTSSPGAVSLALHVDFACAPAPVALAVADLDGDGKNDILVANEAPGTTLSILRNTSVAGSLTADSFAPAFWLTNGNGSLRSGSGLVVADLDGDGKPDIAVTVANQLVIYQNLSAPCDLSPSSFASSVNFAASAVPLGLAVVDLDGDGKLDLICANADGTALSAFWNMSSPGSLASNSFAPRLDLPVGFTSFAVAAGDFDGDGKPDLVALGNGPASIGFLRNEENEPYFLINNSPPSGDTIYVTSSATVEILSRFANGPIYYTLDGSPPDTKSARYSDPFVVTDSAILRALAFDSNLLASAEAPALSLFVVAPPGITLQPQGLTVDAGLDALLSAAAAGTPPLSYAWTFNGLNLTGATNSTLFLPRVGPEQAGDYQLVVHNDYGAATSAVATVTVLTPPSILAPPTDVTASLGDSVIFSVSASGLPPIGFQWRKNGVNIAGATNDSLAITNVQVGDGATYTVVVSNPGGTVIADPAQLLISDVLFEPGSDYFASAIPLLETSGLIGGTNTLATREPGEPLHAGKPGSNSVWYAWTPANDGIATFSTVGSTFDTLLAVYVGVSVTKLTPIASDDDSGGFLASKLTFNALNGVTYYIVIDGFNGQSGRYVLQWAFEPTSATIPVITCNPANQTVLRGGTAFFTVSATGSDLAYLWLFNGNPISGTTNSSYARTNVQPSDVGLFSVRVTGAGNRSVDSLPAILEIGPFPDLQSQEKPGDVFPVCSGSFALASRFPHFSSGGAASVAMGSIGYQVLVSSTNNLTDFNVTNCGGIPRGTRFLELSPAANATFVLDTSGSTPLTRLWVVEKGTNNLDLTHTFIGCDTSSAADGRSLVRFAAEGGRTYQAWIARIDDSSGTLQLNWKLGLPPVFTSVPSDCFLAEGSTLFLNAPASNVVAAGVTTPLAGPALGWYFAGPAPLCSDSDLTIPNLQQSHAGQYTICASNDIGSTSAIVRVEVHGPASASVLNNGDGLELFANDSIAACPGGLPTYQWNFDGQPLAGQTSRSLILRNVQATHAGAYSVTVSNCFGATTYSVSTVAVRLDVAFSAHLTSDGHVLLQWQTIPGKHYRVEYRTSFTSPTWTPLGSDLTATSFSLWATDQVTTIPRFYRIVMLD